MPQYFGQLHRTAQAWTELGAVRSIEKIDRGICCDCGNARLQITVLAANLVRIRLAPSGEFLPRRDWAVTRDDREWAETSVEVVEQPDAIVLKTEQIQLRVHRDPCRIVGFDQAGNSFAADDDRG
ncbi:MAG TPA: DUF4968 domain-containing protein, partial [Allocoleopsis sp.]